MDFKFFLNNIEVEEPIGWDDFELSMKRDDVYHGMQFEASTGTLRFFGDGANYLRTQNDNNALLANVIFVAQETCDTTYEEIYRGRVNFGKYKATCGDACLVNVPIEEEGCKVIFKNRFDQKVDIDKLIALDNSSVLPAYTQLGQTITLPAVALDARVEGYVKTPGDSQFSSQTAGGTDRHMVRPNYEDSRFNSIATGQLIAVNNSEDADAPITPQLLFDEQKIKCFDGNFTYSSKLKGTYLVNTVASGTLQHIIAQFILWDGVGNIYTDGNVIENHVISTTPQSLPVSGSFDIDFSGVIANLPEGTGVYNVIKAETTTTTGGTGDVIMSISFTTDTFFNISAKKLCPDSTIQYYMVHETLSRVVESITNKCMRVKSSYYGRTDSQPFAFSSDGCGGLRLLTSGLKIRNAPDASFFASAKDLIAGLNGIDNIGFGVELDPMLTDRFVLRVEDVAYFYKDENILNIDFIASATDEVQEQMHYAKINVGYKKWEVENVNGLNEFNTNREYRTNVETISTTLDITSGLVAGSIPIEITRQQSFADSGAADTTYDNEAFVICVKRNMYDFGVEQNQITSGTNIFDAATTLNYRISPIRNLMRWFKSIINSYPYLDSNFRLFFNAGTGNFTASGILTDSDCRLENSTGGALAENEDLSYLRFKNTVDYTPIWRNEIKGFEYPLSIKQYNTLKNNPYGYITLTCGANGAQQKYFIKEIKFKPAKGIANFNLIKKWS